MRIFNQRKETLYMLVQHFPKLLNSGLRVLKYKNVSQLGENIILLFSAVSLVYLNFLGLINRLNELLSC